MQLSLLENISKILDRVVEDSRCWTDALDLVSTLAGGSIAELIPADPNKQVITSRSGEEFFSDYFGRKWNEQNPRIAKAMTMPVALRLQESIQRPHGNAFESEFLSDAELFPNQEHEGMPFYEEYLARHGMKWACGAPILTLSGNIMFLAIERSPGQGQFQPNELYHLRCLIEPIQRAATLAGLVASAEHRGILAAFNAVGIPAFLIDGAGTIRASNAVGDKLAKEGGIISRGRFTASSSTDQKTIDELLRSVCTMSFSTNAKQLRAVVNRQDNFPIVLHGIRIPAQFPGLFSGVRAVVLAIDPGARLQPTWDSLASVFGFTHAEARVAQQLAAGKSAAMIAAEFNISVPTVRSQIRAIFDKANVHRQIELVALVRSLVDVNQF